MTQGNLFDGPVIIGKDLLELLSSSMYTNPLVVFREYVQNATDAIDDAVTLGLLSNTDEGNINISLDYINRRIVIRDNGSGIPNNDFPIRMLSLGASIKRGTDARGLRGVGRLSGLGFAQKLIFRSRSIMDKHVLEVSWDLMTVKKLLASENDTDLQTIIPKAVTFRECESLDYPSHFFEVELSKPRRIGNDCLLNEREIESYISQVCPCPLQREFKHSFEIEKMLAKYGRHGKSYNIYINESSVPVCRPYCNEINYSEKKVGLIGEEVKKFEVPKHQGEGLSAVGWYVHHDYQGAIPISTGIRGLRARIGNIQIGNERLLAEIFPEERFCSWAIGEVHVLDEFIQPTGRRDAFETNIYFDHLINYLRGIGADIGRGCRLASKKRNRHRAVEFGINEVSKKLEIIKQGAVSSKFVQLTSSEVHDLLNELLENLHSKQFEETERNKYKSQIEKIEAEVKTFAKHNESDKIAFIPEEKREVYKEVFELIYSCSVNQSSAKKTIDSILKQISRSYALNPSTNDSNKTI